MADNTQDRLPPPPVDFSKNPARSTVPLPRLRADKTVLVRTDRTLPIPDLARRAKAEKDGGEVLREAINEIKQRRLDTAIARGRQGATEIDWEAEAFTLATIKSFPELRRALDFDVEVREPVGSGEGQRSVTTSAFSLLVSALASTDAMIGAESVPMISDEFVTDFDDVVENTEVPELLELGFEDPSEYPKRLGETEEFHEVGAGEERYTILHHRNGYQRAFSQQVLDQLGGSIAAQQLMDIGRGAMQVLEQFYLRKLIDFDGSQSSGSEHVMIRNRSAAALFSSTANTPSTRTPDGTRIDNNSLVDQSDVENMRARLAGMLNNQGYPAPVPFRKMLVPDALWLRAWTLLNSVNTPTVFGETNFFGPGGPVRPALFSTPLLDIFTTDSFYGGDPQPQFLRKYRLRPTVATHGGRGTEAFVRSHEALRVSIGWDATVGVRSHTRWVQSLAGTTAPGD